MNPELRKIDVSLKDSPSLSHAFLGPPSLLCIHCSAFLGFLGSYFLVVLPTIFRVGQTHRCLAYLLCDGIDLSKIFRRQPFLSLLPIRMHIDPLLLCDLKQFFVRYVWIVDSKGAAVVGLVSFVEFGLVCALGRKVHAETEPVLEVYFAAVVICFPVVFRSRPVFLAEFRGVEMLPAIAYIMNLV